jgi:hypothetical protein
MRAARRAGFAVVFAVWLLCGYQFVRNLELIERNVADVHNLRGEQLENRTRCPRGKWPGCHARCIS